MKHSLQIKPIKNSQFVFTDSDEDCVKKIFLREKYFEFVCLLITAFYQKEIIENDFYNYFVNLLNDLEDDQDVFFIEHHIPPHWALCIIQNKHTTDTYNKNDENRLSDIWLEFTKHNRLKSFIIDYNISN
ncbi:hypothetical protein [Chryseobacterium sp.]|uniref:hypothetical protein n=1 Tax=Chryseobacterium sp. TaxID=1871047 RepID=UPI002FCAA8ED